MVDGGWWLPICNDWLFTGKASVAGLPGRLLQCCLSYLLQYCTVTTSGDLHSGRDDVRIGGPIL